MKILIEGYQYQEADVKHILQGFEPYTMNGKTKIDYVGYFFSKEIGDCIFFLPKVLMNERNEILFHEDLTPEKILDLDVALKNEWVKKDDYDFLSQFSVWIFRAIKEFYRLNPNSEILLHKSFSMLDRSDDEKDATLLDIILSLIRFNNENQDFFMFTIKNIHSGYNKINWNKTISQSAAVMQHKIPIYLDPVNKKKQINFDEELLIIFFSILAHVNGKYGFRTPINYNYELIREVIFENYLAGYGLIRLRQIKYKYFSDKALQLWNLCYTFFEAAEKINSSSQDCDYLIARNFNIVFESIIDELIGDDKTKIDASLKDQPDGKIVDHIFRYSSLINESDIYYIGDSKYYKIGGSLGGNSIYKQYTYAKNIIQFNIDWFFEDKQNNRTGDDCRAKVHYRDELTEGYNITPNFFISAEVREELSYADDEIKPRDNEKDRHKIFQFENRLFDRDTLWLSHYNINFLYIIALYARSNIYEKQLFKEKAQKEFKQKITELINSQYEFCVLEPRMGYSLQRAIDINFKRLYGKVFRPYVDRNILILALQKGAAENQEVKDEIKPYFYIHKGYEIGKDVDETLSTAQRVRTQFATYVQQDNFVDRVAAEAEVKYGTVERIFNDSEVGRKDILDDNQLSADVVEHALPLEQETVLVGYYDGDAHFAEIRKNLLYYVRIGFRRGSLRIEPDTKRCKYLFLHNKSKYYMFKLTGDAPRLFTGKQLMEKNFLVRKPEESYLGFDLASADPVEFYNIDIQKAIIRGIGNRTAESYFTTLKELFNL